jgi:hypothetical protein
MLKGAYHLSLSWPIWTQSTSPRPVSVKSILILTSHQCLGLPSSLVPSGFPATILNAFHLPDARYMSHPSHPWFHHPDNNLWRVQSTDLRSFLQPPVTSSLLGPNILLSTLFPNTFILCSSLYLYQPYVMSRHTCTTADHVSHQHATKPLNLGVNIQPTVR